MRLFIIGLLVAMGSSLLAQNSTIKGVVKDKVSELELIGANIRVLNIEPFRGAVTDEAGKFLLEGIAPGRYTLEVSYLGYQPSIIPNILVTSGKETDLEIGLDESVLKLDEVVITNSADKEKAINEMAAISARTFSLEEVSRYSGGRNDASRLVSNFAGVSTTNDSRNDIVVRGNSPAGILWRLEGVAIPNPNHFSTLGTTGGPVSALNTNLLKNSDFLTSAFPAEYGNAVSGVFDVGFRSGNKDKREFTLQLAAFSGLEAMAEGPIGKKGDKSYLISYRYSFVQLASTFGLKFGTNATPKYQDLTFNFDLGKTRWGNFRIFGIGATSDINFKAKETDESDLFADKDADSRATSNIGVVGIKHNLVLNENNYVRSTFTLSQTTNKYDELRYADTTLTNGYDLTATNDKTNRASLHTFLNTKYSAKLSSRVGITIDSRMLNSLLKSREDNADGDADGLPDWSTIRDINGAITTFEPYASFKYKPTEKMTWIVGLHGLIQSLNTKAMLEPRLGFNYQLTSKATLNAGYGLHSQMQPLPVFFLLSKDVDNQYRPLNEDLDFSKSHHFVVGVDYKIAKDWRIKTEAYYQHLFNIPIERTASAFSIVNAGADFVFPQIGNLVNDGIGRNYGLELTVEKFFSQGFYSLVTGSLFQSKYKGSDGIERNTAFNNEYVLNVLGGKEWKIGKSAAFTTDIKFTTAGGRYMTPIDAEASRLTKREIRLENVAFSEKLNDYLRLDVKIGVRLNKKGFSQQFYLDFQNVTNNKNVFVKKYNRQSNAVNTVYQIGFFPDILWRVQF